MEFSARLLDDMYEVQREEMTRFMLTMEQASKQFEVKHGAFFLTLCGLKDILWIIELRLYVILLFVFFLLNIHFLYIC